MSSAASPLLRSFARVFCTPTRVAPRPSARLDRMIIHSVRFAQRACSGGLGAREQ